MGIEDKPDSKRITDPNKAQVVAEAGRYHRNAVDEMRKNKYPIRKGESEYHIATANSREDEAAIDYDVDQLVRKMNGDQIAAEIERLRQEIKGIKEKSKLLSESDEKKVNLSTRAKQRLKKILRHRLVSKDVEERIAWSEDISRQLEEDSDDIDEEDPDGEDPFGSQDVS